MRTALRIRSSSGLQISLLCSLYVLASTLVPVAVSAEDDASSARVTVDHRGLEARSPDDRFRFRVFGRVHADGTLHLGDTPADAPGDPPINRGPTSGTELRRARLAASATVDRDWTWFGELDFANNGTRITDFTVGYRGFDGLNITVGHQKQPYSLHFEMSSNDLPFTERSIESALLLPLIDRAIGVRAEVHGRHWYAAGGFYGDSVAPGSPNTDEGWGAAAKAVYAPLQAERSLVHVGFRGSVRRPETDNESLRFRDETTNMSDYHVVDTGTIEDIDLAILFGPEAAVAFGPVALFGEYNRAVLQRNGLRTLEFESGYVAATWLLTGESHATSYTIKTGEFKRLEPKNPFSLRAGTFGAWELAARYAYVNLNDGGVANPVPGNTVAGGRQQALDVALNWHPNRNVRLMFNWKHILQADVGGTSAGNPGDSVDPEVTKEGEGLDVFTLRAQFAF